MKATVRWSPGETFLLTAYEKGDEPESAVDIPPALVNEWQKAELARQNAVHEIIAYLRSSGQAVREETS